MRTQKGISYQCKKEFLISSVSVEDQNQIPRLKALLGASMPAFVSHP
jgi:hypothetical protein